ncbi:autotransporter domain-containing protein [Oryzibacter oryziterrae]|uniref:autotransporter domain-containing protein n=1 Tax=Oryzibacter oryziterrae TaxID=2766474 RepID=UPI001F4724B3|nr:autotransporter domain-containing protein [Oryzibacter oryziterrae]
MGDHFSVEQAIETHASGSYIDYSFGDPSHGHYANDGDHYYNPDSCFVGTDTISYTLFSEGPDGTISTTGTITINVTGPTVTVSPASLADGVVGTGYSQTVSGSSSTSGTWAYSVSAGSLPAGLGIDTGSGEISGTPTAAGTSSFTIEAALSGTSHGSCTFTGTRDYSITVSAAPPVASDVSMSVEENSSGNAVALSISGSYTSVAAATSPSHGSISVAGTTMSYTPDADYSGPDSFTYTATGPGGTSNAATVSITVSSTPPVAADVSMTVEENSSGNAVALSISGGYTSVAAATSPSHGSVSVAGTGMSYTPSADYSGADSFTYTATGPGGTSNVATVSITVQPVTTVTLTLTPASLPHGVVGAPYSETFVASGGTAPYTYEQRARASGLPAGFVLAADTGILAGTPREAGTFTFSVTATDSGAHTVTRSYSLIIDPKPDPLDDPEVHEIVDTQGVTADRFAFDQMDNVNGHLEGLHGANCLVNSLDANLSGGQTDLNAAPAGSATASAGGTGGGAKTGPVASKRKDEPGASCSTLANGRMAVWSAGNVNFGSTKANGDLADFISVGLSAGLDFRLNSDLVIGGGLGFGRDKTDIGDQGTSVDGKAVLGFVYGSWTPVDNVFVDGVAGVGTMSFDTDRYVLKTDSLVSGTRDGRQVFGSLTAGYTLENGGLTFSPYGRISAAYSVFDPYDESGSTGNELSFGRQTRSTVTGLVGVRLAYAIETEWALVEPRLRLEYGHDFTGSSALEVTYAGGGSGGTSASGTDSQADFFNVGIGGDVRFTNDVALGLDYTLRADGDGVSQQQIRFSLVKQF